MLELGRAGENHGMWSLQWTISIEFSPHLFYHLYWKKHKNGFNLGQETMSMNYVGAGPDNMQSRNRVPDTIEMNFHQTLANQFQRIHIIEVHPCLRVSCSQRLIANEAMRAFPENRRTCTL